jgi:lathosterol oxidase
MFKNLTDTGHLLQLWLIGFIVVGIVAGIASGFFKARKIQPNGFKWKVFRNEALFAIFGLVVTAFTLGKIQPWLIADQWIVSNSAPAAWWVIAAEYAAYFLLFDTWFYWLHRWMHKEPAYKLIHKLHHLSTSPNLLTTLSVNPLESLINGGFVPLFLTVCTLLALPIHSETLVLILPTNIIMGPYVRAGYEFLPRWWNKTWATKWFITTTFHDQHHKYFNYNFGGYTTIWDRLCGTMRKKYEADFEKNCDRRRASEPASVPGGSASGMVSATAQPKALPEFAEDGAAGSR